MKQADPTLYAGVSRAERRRIAKALADLEARNAQKQRDAERLRAEADRVHKEVIQPGVDAVVETMKPTINAASSVVFTDQHRSSIEAAMSAQIQAYTLQLGMVATDVRAGYMRASELRRSAAIPVGLLPCGHCHRPTSQCICLDAEGKPFDWGA